MKIVQQKSLFTLLIFSTLYIFSFAGLAQDSAADSELIGSVHSTNVKAYPIAIPELSSDQKYSKSRRFAVGLTAILRRDFEYSALFKVLAPSSYLQKTQTQKPIKYDPWLQIGADAFVYAHVRGSGNRFTIEVNLYGTAEQKTLFKKIYHAEAKQLRSIAHTISDDLYRSLSGQKGHFSTKIAAVKRIHGQKQIVILDVDGQREKQMTRSGTLNILPSWSPNGRQLLFTSYRRNNPDLYRLNIAGGASTPISSREGLNTGGVFSPDGRTIVLTLSKDGNSELYSLDTRGGMKRRLTKSWGTDTSANFSPDGRFITFVSSRRKHPHIFVMPAAGGTVKRLTFQGKYSQTPHYHPNGRFIVYTARDERNRLDLFLINVETGELQRITQNQGNNESPSFSPNGNLIAFVSDRSGSRQIWISSLAGDFQKQLTFSGGYDSPSWSPFLN